MKTATFFALLCTALLLLYQAFYFLSFNFFHSLWGRLNYRGMTTTYGVLFLLFLTSLSFFFLVLYKNQKS